ncbi:MAG: YceI family protein [Bacteroidota bacterium]
MNNQIKWSIDQSHSEITFKVRHLMIAHVKGSFKVFDANIYTTEHDFKTAVIDVWIDSSSIDTGDAKRDDHLKSADFFDTENHKQIIFTSETIQPEGTDGNHELWGELMMKGITKNVKLMVTFGGLVTDPWGVEKAGFTITGTINRSDWGLEWNTALQNGGFMVSDEVTISCEVELINQGNSHLQMDLDASASTQKATL